MDPQEVDARVAAMLADGKSRLDAMLRAGDAGPLWAPEPGNAPQIAAYNSPADILLYGGAAGGGKSDLLLGLAVTAHRRAVIFRRAYTDLLAMEERLIAIMGSRAGYHANDMVLRHEGRMLEFGALDRPRSEYN